MPSHVGKPRTLASVHPALAAELLLPELAESLAPCSNVRVEWFCDAFPALHPTWHTTPGLRVTQESGCPACAKLPEDWHEQWRTLATEGYTTALRYEGRRHYLTGTCRRGHVFDAEVRRIRHGRRCQDCRFVDTHAEHLHLALAAGYDVELYKHSTGRAGIRGHCPIGHPYDGVLNNFRVGRRCGECHAIIRADSYEEVIAGSPHDVKVEYRLGEGLPETWIVGSCSAGHDYATRGSQFVMDSSCPRCNYEERRAAWRRIVEDSGYVANVVDTLDRGARVVGFCPSGHAVDMDATSFTRIGNRCAACAERGFKPNLDGTLYVIWAEDMRGWGEVVKFGISNDPRKRLARHARTGFLVDQAVQLHGDGYAVQRLESELKRRIRDAGAQVCHDVGLVFDGSTESFFADSLSRPEFMELLCEVACELGIPLDGTSLRT